MPLVFVEIQEFGAADDDGGTKPIRRLIYGPLFARERGHVMDEGCGVADDARVLGDGEGCQGEITGDLISFLLVNFWECNKLVLLAMNIRIPAPRKVRTTSRISGRSGSTMASNPTKVKSVLDCSRTASSNWLVLRSNGMSDWRMTFRASKMQRFPWLLYRFFISSNAVFTSLSKGWLSPALVVKDEHLPMRTSGAPFIVNNLACISTSNSRLLALGSLTYLQS